MKPINVVNASDKQWSRHSYLLWFGLISPIYLLIYDNSLDSAIETAGSWLAEHAPGHLMEMHGEEHEGLLQEACQDAGLEYPPKDYSDMDPYWKAFQDAEADLTYTESGYLTSYEWGIIGEDLDRNQLIEIYHDRCNSAPWRYM